MSVQKRRFRNLYAAGECYSPHHGGANRLGWKFPLERYTEDVLGQNQHGNRQMVDPSRATQIDFPPASPQISEIKQLNKVMQIPWVT